MGILVNIHRIDSTSPDRSMEYTYLVIWGFSQIGVLPNRPFERDFAWNKASSYWGTNMLKWGYCTCTPKSSVVIGFTTVNQPRLWKRPPSHLRHRGHCWGRGRCQLRGDLKKDAGIMSPWGYAMEIFNYYIRYLNIVSLLYIQRYLSIFNYLYIISWYAFLSVDGRNPAPVYN